MKLLRGLFRFVGRVIKAAIGSIKDTLSGIAKNAAGVALLSGAAIGFTKMAVELPFQVMMPLWIESTMVAPIIGVFTVILLVQLMKFQLRLQGVRA